MRTCSSGEVTPAGRIIATHANHEQQMGDATPMPAVDRLSGSWELTGIHDQRLLDCFRSSLSALSRGTIAV